MQKNNSIEYLVVLFRQFSRFTISLPKDFINTPEKVFQALEMKKNLKLALNPNSSVSPIESQIVTSYSTEAFNISGVTDDDSSFVNFVSKSSSSLSSEREKEDSF